MIIKENLFPAYIPRRKEEQFILDKAAEVHADRLSRAILFYGPGGAGKTSILRHLAQTSPKNGFVWLDPVDADDSEYWLLANLGLKIASELDKEGRYFREYFENLSKLSMLEHKQIGHETIVSHLRQRYDIFLQAYKKYISDTGKTPILILDTIETVRGTDFLFEVIQTIKYLPQTLFVLAGRPPRDGEELITREFSNPYNPLPYSHLEVSNFSREEAIEYLKQSKIADAINEDEMDKLAELTLGHPLWLALTVHFLDQEGMPDEAKKTSLTKITHTEIRENRKPETLKADFITGLLSPYNEDDFWNESIRRLSVLRRRVNKDIWKDLMSDLSLPDGVNGWDDAWEKLLGLPWVRPRINNKYVTLHDALAEELAKRVIPLRDKDRQWRNQLWNTAAKIYKKIVDNRHNDIAKQKEELDEDYKRKKLHESGEELVHRSTELEVNTRELHQLSVTYYYYQLLSDYESAAAKLGEEFERITAEHDFRLGQLLWVEIQRFISGESATDPLEPIIKPKIDELRNWFASQGDLRFKLLSNIADYLVNAGYHSRAEELSDYLIKEFKDAPSKEYKAYIIRGNARMHTSGQSKSAKEDFEYALKLTENSELKDRAGEAHKELGYYFRHMGHLDLADRAYRNAINNTFDPVERASIQANWSYIKGLRGDYPKALELIRTALSVRRKRNMAQEVAMALSIKGEIHRYMQEFEESWQSFEEAEDIFKRLGLWPWLGQIYQQQAVCRYQEWELKGEDHQAQNRNLFQEAQTLALRALDICNDWNRRALPSALNRAGRIFAVTDTKRALDYLDDGRKRADEVGDGWFLFANIIEHAELSYREFVRSGNNEYRLRIEALAPDVAKVSSEYNFTDLKGRWELLRGHIVLNDGMSSSDEGERKKYLGLALDRYKAGFPLIAKGFVGSHGLRALRKEFNNFNSLFSKLPRDVRLKWCDDLRLAWSTESLGYIDNSDQADYLQSYITEIYEEVAMVQGAKEANES
jgi:tetratricopeptide (TPR) repeat protein